MSFTDHKISQFVHRVVDLPDQPNLPSDELKARFDSSPEELRVAHNALCDDADRLDDRVSGIIAETFGDTISKSMLSDELQEEIDAKAEQTALTAEATARQSGDTALQNTVAQKCTVVIGTYTGNGSENQFINLNTTPKAVLIADGTGQLRNGDMRYGAIAVQGSPAQTNSQKLLEICENGFQVYAYSSNDIFLNSANGVRKYIALI